MCLRLFENACKIETFGLEEHDEIALTGLGATWKGLHSRFSKNGLWPMLYMCLNIPQIYFKYARCPMTSYHGLYIQSLYPYVTYHPFILMEHPHTTNWTSPMPHWLRSKGLHDVPLSRHLIQGWMPRQGVGCLGCKLYDLILRCFTTGLQFFSTLVGKWCVPSDLCPAGRLFHCSKTPTPALSSRNTSCRRKGLDSAMRALGILMYRRWLVTCEGMGRRW